MTHTTTKESVEFQTPIESAYFNSNGLGASVLLRDCMTDHNVANSVVNSFTEYNDAHFLDFSAYDTEEEEAIVPLDGRSVERCCPLECNKIFPPNLLQEHRRAFENLGRTDQDMLILSHLQQGRHSAALESEYSKREAGHEPRFAGEEVSRQEIEYFFLALKICRRMYFYLHPLRTKRYRNLIARFDASLIINQSRSATGKRRGRPKKVHPVSGIIGAADVSTNFSGKRKRGRPKKSEEINGNSTFSDVSFVKRKPGRPRKSMVDDFDMFEAHFLSAATEENSTNGLFPERKRGRPKKSTDGSIFKRRPGRPKKSEQVTQSAEERDIPFADIAMDAKPCDEFIVPEVVEPTIDSSKVVQKRGRGRPKKSEMSFSNLNAYKDHASSFFPKQMRSLSRTSDFVSENAIADDTQTLSYAEEESSIDDPMKRKRGRPKKHLSAIENTDKSASHNLSMTSDDPIKRKRGRPKKNLLNDTDSSMTSMTAEVNSKVVLVEVHKQDDEKVMENAASIKGESRIEDTQVHAVPEDSENEDSSEDSTDSSDDSEESDESDSEDTSDSGSAKATENAEVGKSKEITKNAGTTEDSEKNDANHTSTIADKNLLDEQDKSNESEQLVTTKADL